MESEEAWINEGKSCPGIGKGKLVPKKEIERRLKAGEEPPYIIIKK